MQMQLEFTVYPQCLQKSYSLYQSVVAFSSLEHISLKDIKY